MVKSVRALARGLKVVEELAGSPGLSLAELQRRTGLPKATVLRTLVTLMEQGWAYRSLGDGRYRLRAGLRLRGLVPHPYEKLVEASGPILERLYDQTGWPSDIGVRDDIRMHIIETSRRVSTTLDYDVVGFQPHMLWSAMGRAYFAFCPEDERAELAAALGRSPDPRDRRAVAVPAWLEQLVRKTREQGYGVREPGYWGHAAPLSEPPMSIAVPILQKERVTGTLNLVWLASAMEPEAAARRYLPLLQEAAVELAALI